LLYDPDPDAPDLLALLGQTGVRMEVDPVASDAEFDQALTREPALVLFTDRVPLRAGLQVPFVVLATQPDVERAVAAMQAGAADYVPWSRPERLAETVRRLLRDGDAAWTRIASLTARQQALETQERLTAILEATPDLVATLSLDGRPLSINRAGRTMFGFTCDESLENWHISLFHPPRAAARIQNEAIPAALRKGIWQGESVLLTRDGREIPVSVVLLLHRTPRGDPSYLSAVMRDLSEYRRLEQQFHQAQKMEAVGRLAAGVAHDFNNLLTIISGYSELLLGTAPKGDALRGFLEQIKGAGERAARLIRQLLAFSRKQARKPEVLDLNELVGNAEKLLRRLIGEDIELTAALAQDLGRITADPGQLEQVLFNLAVNARDAMPRGGKLTLETTNAELNTAACNSLGSEARPGSYVVLAVSDTGCGMTEEVKAHLFEPFYTTKEPDKGTGLGLATVYGIVKQSGGFLTVDSEPDLGSTFKIYLPRTEAAVASRTRPSVYVAARGTETILVVEDQAEVRKLARQALEMNGYQVLEAASGMEAISVSAAHPDPIHLLLSDVVMPGLSGRELCDELVKGRERLQVLYMSGYADDAVVRHGILPPAVNFIQKPFTPLGLVRKVREVLDRQAPSVRVLAESR
jgi:PAS domain S-box-containing protein